MKQSVTDMLNKKKLNWKQLNAKYIEVYAKGCYDEFSTIVERDLFKLGFKAIKRSYNKMDNQTSTIYHFKA